MIVLDNDPLDNDPLDNDRIENAGAQCQR